MTASSDAPPVPQPYRARVRLGNTDTPWQDIEATSPEAAACIVVAKSQPGSTYAAGRLPVEVTAQGSVVVERFMVEYEIKHTALRMPGPRNVHSH